MRQRILTRVLAILLLAGCAPADAQLVNGFDLAGAAVPASTILIGTVRDGIKALDDPTFETAQEAGDLRADDRVLGLVHGGVAKAYPLDLLTYHEIVNDDFGAASAGGSVGGALAPVVVTYCPLCASGMAFIAVHNDRRLTFGVSGLLHNSDLLMFDRGTESLWSQIGARAITGAMQDTALTMLPVVETTWADWKSRHPDTLVLSRDTGFELPYDSLLYPGYAESPGLWYPVEHADDRFPSKALVLGVVLAGHARAWPLPELQREAERRGERVLTLEDTIGGRPVVITYDAEHRTASAATVSGDALPSVVSFWFAWHAFHPEAPAFTAGDGLDQG